MVADAGTMDMHPSRRRSFRFRGSSAQLVEWREALRCLDLLRDGGGHRGFATSAGPQCKLLACSMQQRRGSWDWEQVVPVGASSLEWKMT